MLTRRRRLRLVDIFAILLEPKQKKNKRREKQVCPFAFVCKHLITGQESRATTNDDDNYDDGGNGNNPAGLKP